MTAKELMHKLCTEDLPDGPFGEAMQQFHAMYPKRDKFKFSHAEIMHTCFQVFCNAMLGEVALMEAEATRKMQRYFDIHVQNQMDWKGQHSNADCPLGSGLSCEYADRLRELKGDPEQDGDNWTDPQGSGWKGD